MQERTGSPTTSTVREPAPSRSPAAAADGRAEPAADIWRDRWPVRVLDERPEFGAELDARALAVARQRVVASTVWIDAGPWLPPPAERERFPGWLGLLVLDGLVSRTVAFGHLTAQELIGPGDLLRPWEDDVEAASVPPAREWCVLERCRLAVLDDRFAALACRWPPVMSALFGRTTERARSLAVHLAIAQARQAEVRLLLLFWHLADRWGRVSPEGTVMPVPLTHERIAQLVCLRRPTVSMALGRLAKEGELERRADGTWLLPKPPPTLGDVVGNASRRRLAAGGEPQGSTSPRRTA